MERITGKVVIKSLVLGGAIVVVTPMIVPLIPAGMQFPLGTITSAAAVVVAGALAFVLDNFVVNKF